MPLSTAKLRALSETDVTVPIAPEAFMPVLTQPPFVPVEGTFNVRDIGRVPGAVVRPGFAFRSGMLSKLTPRGQATLAKDLGVRRVFDLRSQLEHRMGPDVPPAPDVAMVWLSTSEASPTLALAPFADGLGEQGFATTYLDVLASYRPTIAQLLEHVRDRPTEPFLFHCTAGRDRTGVVAGLLATLAGTPRDVVVLDYLLSRIGSEPVRKELEAFARMGAGIDPASDAVPPGFLNLISLRAECWDAFLVALDEEHGGYEGYAKSLGFTDADLATIKTNLTTG